MEPGTAVITCQEPVKNGKDLCSDVPSAAKEAPPRHTVLSVGKAGAGEDGAEPKDPPAAMTLRCSSQLQSQAFYRCLLPLQNPPRDQALL